MIVLCTQCAKNCTPSIHGRCPLCGTMIAEPVARSGGVGVAWTLKRLAPWFLSGFEVLGTVILLLVLLAWDAMPAALRVGGGVGLIAFVSRRLVVRGLS